jgi:hypothetical protein
MHRTVIQMTRTGIPTMHHALCSLLLAGTALVAVTGATAAQPGSGTALETRVVPLRSVVEGGGLLELRGRSGQLRFNLPAEAGKTAGDLKVRVAYDSTREVVPQRSRLWVYLNGSGVAELPLDREEGVTSAEIVLPAGLLAERDNTLTFWAQQEHRDGCDAKAAGALWTRFDPNRSYMLFDAEHSRRPASLADLSDPSGFLQVDGTLPILTAGAVERPALLRAGALAAEGLALRIGDRTLTARQVAADGAALRGSGGKIVLGTRDEVAGILGARAPAVTGPYLGMVEAPDAESGRLLVVSGRDDAELLAAAQALANPALALPDAPDMMAPARVPDPKTRAAVLEPDRAYAFSALSVTTDGRSNGTEPRTVVDLPLPGDMVASDNRKVALRLNYSYAAGLARNSVLNVLVNGRYVSMIALDDPAGGEVRGEEIRLPLNLFQPGTNIIAFEPLIGADDAVGCTARPATAATVRLHADSEIAVPDLARVARQPDLRQFGASGYPYTDPNFEPNSEILASNRDAATVGAVWTLAARLSQLAGRPLTDLDIGFKPSPRPKHAIVVGAADAIAPELLGWAGSGLASLYLGPPVRAGLHEVGPLLISQANAAAPIVANELSASNAVAGLAAFREMPVTASLDRFEKAVRHVQASWNEVAHYADTDNAARFGLDAGADNDGGVIAAFESPWAPQHTVTLIAAQNADMLERNVQALVRPAVWQRLDGDQVAWSAATLAVTARSEAEPYHIGPLPTEPEQIRLYVNSVLAENPAGWTLLSLLGIAVLAGLTCLGLKQRKY